MPIKIIIFILFFLSSLYLSAAVQANITLTDATESKSAVEVKVKNTYGQNISSARVWVFLMDSEGKVVGEQAQWLPKTETGIVKPDQTKRFPLVLDTKAKPTQVKMTFSRVILQDGTLVNPNTDVEVLE
jgi:P pilus assembly chaperone PapD